MRGPVWARAMALVVALALWAAGCAAQNGEDPVLFTFNGQDVYQSKVVAMAEAYAQAGMISGEGAYDEAIEYMIVNQLVPQAKAAELGLDQYSQEELDQINQEAEEYFEAQLDAYANGLLPEASQEEKEQFRQDLQAYWAETGTTLETAKENHLFNYTKERLLETMKVEITPEEIQQVFEEQVQKDKDYFTGNITAYEYFTVYQNSDVWYIPEGFRGVLQILLYADEDLTQAYEDAVDAGEGVEEARQAVLDSKQDIVEQIYDRLDAGEDFVSLMWEYTEDPAMDEDLAQTGYAVHQDSRIWVEEFTQGAFGDEMQAVGDVSQPVVSKYGVHILYYLRDIPSGPVEMDQRIEQSIQSYLTNQKRVQMLEDWAQDYPVEYNQQAIDQLMQQ